MNRAEKERNREFRRLQFNHLGKQIIYLKKELESWRGLADVKPIEVKIAECEEERQKIMDEWGKGESMNEMASKFLKVMLSIVLFTIGLFLMIAAPFVFKETSSSTTSYSSARRG